jgi:Fe2+ or Zn2+ uptake regulation protein
MSSRRNTLTNNQKEVLLAYLKENKRLYDLKIFEVYQELKEKFPGISLTPFNTRSLLNKIRGEGKRNYLSDAQYKELLNFLSCQRNSLMCKSYKEITNLANSFLAFKITPKNVENMVKENWTSKASYDSGRNKISPEVEERKAPENPVRNPEPSYLATFDGNEINLKTKHFEMNIKNFKKDPSHLAEFWGRLLSILLKN